MIQQHDPRTLSLSWFSTRIPGLCLCPPRFQESGIILRSQILQKTSFSKFPQKTKRQSAFQPEWAEYELYIITGYKKHWCQNILIFTYFPISIFISYNHLFFSKIYLLYIYINNYYMIVVKTNNCWLTYSAIFKYLTIRHIKLPTRKSHLHR